ncbi:MAG: glycosyltransferase [Propylenella sp.]
MRTAVIVSPYFPPSSLAGVHRARHLAKHLPAAGWTPLVLCVDEAHYEQRLDRELAALVPPTVEIRKVGALSVRWTRLAGIGDIGLRAFPYLRRALVEVLSRRPVGVVLFTGAPYYPMLLASLVGKRFGVPVVLDFQDPWVSSWAAAQPVVSKAGLSHKLAAVLEPIALRNADFVTSVSDVQNAEMVRRHPSLNAKRMAGIPIGGDPEDFAALRRNAADGMSTDLEPGFIHLSYVGTYWPAARPTVTALFRALRRLRDEMPDLARRIRLNFFGTSSSAADNVRSIAVAEGVAESIREISNRLPYLRALAVVAQSDGLLLPGSDEPHFTASKIYTALMSGRPYLSLYHRASSAHAILSAAGGGRALAFSSRDELPSLEPAIAEGLKTLALAPQSLGRADPAAYAPYEARAIARRFAGIFDSLAEARRA